MTTRILSIACLVLPLGWRGQTHATVLPPGFVEEVVAGGFDLPTALAFLPDGRLLVAEKSGVIWMIKEGTVLSTPFSDVSGHVNQYWDRGFVAMAVDPNFSSNGYVYFFYPFEHDPSDPTGAKTARFTRVTVAGDVAGTETVLLGSVNGSGCAVVDPQCIPQDWYGHGANAIRFAPDGTIFLSLGDASNWDVASDFSLRAQDIGQYPGKILRVSPNGEGLADNPFFDGDPGSIRSRVWAFGLRNPFRFAVHPSTGVPYVADVGWNDWEELNVATASSNHGWPCYEGFDPQPAFQSQATCQTLYAAGTAKPPSLAWSHQGVSAAVVGGPFTPASSSFPAEYHGGFFYADYAQNWIRFVAVGSDGDIAGAPLAFASDADGPVSLEFGPQGDLYYLAIASGELRRVTYTSAPPPTGSRYLSDLIPSAAPSNGWGPWEADQSNGESAANDGNALSIGGQTFAKGLGVHAFSELVYDIGGGCSSFIAAIGVDDEVGANGSVVFEVWDGTTEKLFDSGLRRGGEAPLAISVDVSGVQLLRLIVTDGGDDPDFDHADWADARVTCGTTGDTTPPAIFGVSATATARTARIEWQTDEPADSQIEYGPTPAYGFTVLDSAVETAHSQLLSDLEPSTMYHFRVSSRDAAGNLAAGTDRTFTTAADDEAAVFLSDLTPVGAPTNGWGPLEIDQSNGENAADDGGPLTLGGQVFAKGLGVHARSEVTYNLSGDCSHFTAQVGIDDEVGSLGSVVFEVWDGDVKLFDSGLRRGSDPPLAVGLGVSGVERLLLVVTDGGDGADFDHADWAAAAVLCGDDGNEPPQPMIASPSPTDLFRVGDIVLLDGSAADPEDGELPASSLRWDITLQHCPGGDCHFHPFLQFTGSSGSFEAPDHGADSFLRLTLTAVDSDGASASVSMDLQAKTAPLTITSSPIGLQIVFGSAVVTTPFETQAIVGSSHTLEALSPQENHEFVSWSDGGARRHLVQIPDDGMTLVAQFTPSSAPSNFVSDLAPVSPPTNGWGPLEVDQSNGELAANDGNPLTIGGVVFLKGLGVHAFSEAVYDLAGDCTHFTAQVGIDDEVGANGSVVFEVWNAAAKLFDSGLRRGGDAPLPISVDVTGVSELRLIVTDGGDGPDFDHADWADARVACGTG